MEIRPGVEVGERAFGIDSCALYSPRGEKFSVCNPDDSHSCGGSRCAPAAYSDPRMADGDIDPATLVAARLSGVELVAKAAGLRRY